MASHKQNQPQGRQNGGVVQGARDQAQAVGERLQEGAAAVGERVQEGYDSAREGLAHRYRQTEGMIARNPGQSVLVGFGVGFGLGVLLTVLLSRREETWYERYVPDSLRNVPDSLRGIPDRLRHGAESLARHIPGR